MTVAVQAYFGIVIGALEAGFHLRQHVAGEAEIGLVQIIRNDRGGLQIVDGGVAKAGDIQRRAVREGLGGTDGVDAAQETSQPHQVVRVFQIRPAAAAARVQGEAETTMLEQGFTRRIR